MLGLETRPYESDEGDETDPDMPELENGDNDGKATFKIKEPLHFVQTPPQGAPYGDWRMPVTGPIASEMLSAFSSMTMDAHHSSHKVGFNVLAKSFRLPSSSATIMPRTRRAPTRPHTSPRSLIPRILICPSS